MSGPVNPGGVRVWGALCSVGHVHRDSWGGERLAGSRQSVFLEQSFLGSEGPRVGEVHYQLGQARIGDLDEIRMPGVSGAFCPDPPLLILTSKCPVYTSPKPGSRGIRNPVERTLSLERGCPVS